MATLAALLVATAAGPAAGAPGMGRGQGQGKAVGQGNGKPVGQGKGKAVGQGNGKPVGQGKGKAVGQGNGKAIGQGNGNAVGQQPPPTVADPASNPAYALPPWNDAQWQSSEEYDTIQTADIDGDDRDELIGRDVTGLQAWDFDLDTGQWQPLYVGGSGFFTDEQGWELKSQYETIGSGDVDGDGADEVFGRGPDGLEVYDFDAATATWSQLPSVGEWTDAQGWTNPVYYTTIQAGDVDGDGDDEVLGRSAAGMQVLDFDGGWSVETTGEFTNAQGWTSAEYYATIRTGDVDGDGRDELLARGAGGMVVMANVDGSWVQEVAGGPFSSSEWESPETYTTIQAADLDGDGDDEVFGRGTGGIHAHDFSDVGNKADAGTWTNLPRLEEFTNVDGWQHPQYYATIQAGDLDGDRRHEVIGRSPTGMVVWGMNAAATTWAEQPTSTAPFSDDAGWDKARHYETIQVADVDGFTPIGSPGSANAGRAELLGRGATGMQTYRFDAKGGDWVSPSAAFPPFTGQALTAYQAINAAMVPEAPAGGVRTAYATESQGNLSQWLTSVKDLVGSPPPTGVSPSTWSQVIQQVEAEVNWAYQVSQWTSGQGDMAEYLHDLVQVGPVVTRLEYEPKSGSALVGDFLVLFAGIADAVSNLGAPGLQVLFGAISAGASFVYSAGQGHSSSSFSVDVADLEDTLDDAAQDTADAIALANTAIATDYGLLATVGGLLNDQTWPIPDEKSEDWLDAERLAARGQTIFIWQTLTPVLTWGDNHWGWVIQGCTNHVCFTGLDGSSYGLWNGSCEFLVKCEPAVPPSWHHVTGEPVAQRFMDQVFTASSTTCLESAWDSTCDLGASQADLFLGRNGWSYACSVKIGETTGGWGGKEWCDLLYEEAATYGSP